MEQCKSIFWCLTGSVIGGRWQRGKSLDEVQSKIAYRERKQMIDNAVYQCVLRDETTDEEMDKLLTLWYVNNFGGLNLCSDVTEEDEALIKKCCIGWVTHEFPRVRKKKKAMA